MKRAFDLLAEDTEPCPACGSDEHRSFYSKRGLDFVECVNCDTVYGSPRPTSHRLNQYYREATCDDYWNERIYPASENARCEGIIKPRVERIRRHGFEGESRHHYP